jgi:hypothetical protein
MEMNNDHAWIKKMAELEDGCDVSVGAPLPLVTPVDLAHRIISDHKRITALEDEIAVLRKVIRYLNHITGDDFCEDLTHRAVFTPEALNEIEKVAHAKLSIVFKAAHAFDQSTSCYWNHEGWRKEALEAADALEKETGKGKT